jgi:hypothetical protein
MIACIRWGSLIWDRRIVDADGNWRANASLIASRICTRVSPRGVSASNPK